MKTGLHEKTSPLRGWDISYPSDTKLLTVSSLKKWTLFPFPCFYPTQHKAIFHQTPGVEAITGQSWPAPRVWAPTAWQDAQQHQSVRNPRNVVTQLALGRTNGTEDPESFWPWDSGAPSRSCPFTSCAFLRMITPAILVLLLELPKGCIYYLVP